MKSFGRTSRASFSFQYKTKEYRYFSKGDFSGRIDSKAA